MFLSFLCGGWLVVYAMQVIADNPLSPLFIRRLDQCFFLLPCTFLLPVQQFLPFVCVQGLGPYANLIKKTEKDIKEMAKKVNDLCGMSPLSVIMLMSL